MSKEENKVNPHAGHRKRLKENIEKTGAYNISDLHFLEYLLTFIIARADTNPIAHALIKEFGSIEEIFNANLSALEGIDGVGNKTAEFLRFMSVVAYMYNKSTLDKKFYVGTLKNLINYLKTIFPPSDTEQFLVLVLNKNYTVKQYKLFKGVSHSLISININELTDYLVQHKANFCVFAHTHPKHSAMPSVSDLETFKKINTVISALDIAIVENVIIGEQNYYSFKQNKMYSYSDYQDISICNSKNYSINNSDEN